MTQNFCGSLHLLLALRKKVRCEGFTPLFCQRAGAEISQGLWFHSWYKKGGKPLMWRWSCVLMRLVTLRSVPARLEVASPSGSQPAKTLLLFSLCTAGLHRRQPAPAGTVLCGCTSTFSIIHGPRAPTSKHWPGRTSAAFKALHPHLTLKTDNHIYLF